MPVDLSAIPGLAKRNRPPLLSRWLIGLLILTACAIFLTSWLWPAQGAVQRGLFWGCALGAPLGVWVLLFIGRWLVWLATELPAQGWDDARERHIASEIVRGQRFLQLKAQVVHLPHVVTSDAPAASFLLPQGAMLPPVVDEATQAVKYIAQFSDAGKPAAKRVAARLRALLEDASLQTTLRQHKTAKPLTVIIQIESNIALSPAECAHIEQLVMLLLPVSAAIHFSPQFGLADIDRWLDEPGTISSLLILSACVRHTVQDGDGEAAVALFLLPGHSADENSKLITRIHRPEHSKSASMNHDSALQALLWGKARHEDVAAVWMAGMGAGNRGQHVLAESQLKFPEAQTADIDVISGRISVVTPWLAAALAAENPGRDPCPQLIITQQENELPWWMVVHPATGS